MPIVDNNILNKWKPYKYNIIKYNNQSNVYNKSIQYNYNNTIELINNNIEIINNNVELMYNNTSVIYNHTEVINNYTNHDLNNKDTSNELTNNILYYVNFD